MRSPTLLDPTRQTGGIRYFQDSEFLEDVFTMNDFGFPLKQPNHPRYLNTEFVGHTFPTKTIDDDERQREHTIRHARIHDQLASDPQYAGGIGWCAFDYNTHANFGSGDRICYHGVTDIFREPKPAAGFYKSQCDPDEEIVLEPAFHWARSDESRGFTKPSSAPTAITSNSSSARRAREQSWHRSIELDPDRTEFAHLKYPPFIYDRRKHDTGEHRAWGRSPHRRLSQRTSSSSRNRSPAAEPTQVRPHRRRHQPHRRWSRYHARRPARHRRVRRRAYSL